MADPTLEEEIASAGIAYGRRHDIFYRAGLVAQVLGAAVLAVLYPLESPFYTIGIMLFNAGALLSGIYLLVWMSWVKAVIEEGKVKKLTQKDEIIRGLRVLYKKLGFPEARIEPRAGELIAKIHLSQASTGLRSSSLEEERLDIDQGGGSHYRSAM